mmetsp:Transcript_24100/g.35718  ORF Transcript_24100/g.35718 Transcript_24100/m.35718 type:complete len:225 (+) Transcript_24100:266-940(+)
MTRITGKIKAPIRKTLQIAYFQGTLQSSLQLGTISNRTFHVDTSFGIKVVYSEESDIRCICFVASEERFATFLKILFQKFKVSGQVLTLEHFPSCGLGICIWSVLSLKDGPKDIHYLLNEHITNSGFLHVGRIQASNSSAISIDCSTLTNSHFPMFQNRDLSEGCVSLGSGPSVCSCFIQLERNPSSIKHGLAEVRATMKGPVYKDGFSARHWFRIASVTHVCY